MNLTDMSLPELKNTLSDYPSFRAKQVYEWIGKGYYIDEMNNVPKDVKNELSKYPFGGVEIINIDDPFNRVIKYLNKLDDGNIVESVLMEYQHGNSLCISSQIGCSMGCTFCASTIDGVVRNLTAGEMAFQVARLNNRFATKDRRGVTNIVVMGSGEPLLNYDNLIKFIHLCKDNLGISPRNISISTCGIVENMRKFADEKLSCNLCLSLHAADEQTRQKLMPIAKEYSIEQTLNALDYYFKQTGRRTIVEYILIAEVNDSEADAENLAKLLRYKNTHVNLIPYNSVEELDYKAPSEKKVDGFLDVLTQSGISATKRRELGDKIDAACGQLRRKFIENKVEE